MTMILTHVKFSLAKPMTLDEATAIFERTAPKYKGREGLLRKTYLLSEDGLTAGAVYFWTDRASAERVYTMVQNGDRGLRREPANLFLSCACDRRERPDLTLGQSGIFDKPSRKRAR